jgi:2-polyprenyl-3-methyl-5-hydroxy-6-metoxy-1,4-benzoquinol methylase
MSKTKEVNYKNKIDKFSSHSLIIREISNLAPLNKKILDIGCFQGDLLNRVKLSQDVTNNYFGADLENYLNRDFDFIKFYLLDLNDSGLLNIFDNQKFDLIILGDILEHLVNPWNSLSNLEQIILPSSKLLISIPNSGHWYFRLKVLLGKIDYVNNGLFDKTHLRFFTKKSSRELINTSEFKVVTLKYSSIPWENIFKFGLITKILSFFERFFIWLRPQLFAYQFIFLVTPKTSKND